MRPQELEALARRFWIEALAAHGNPDEAKVDRLAKATLGLAFGEGVQFEGTKEGGDKP